MAAPWALALLELQKIDLRIRDLNTRLTLLPKERRRIADAKAAIDAEVERYRKKVKATELAIRQAESEVNTIEHSVQKLQQQSALVKKNAEYQTMMAEIAMSRKRIGELETTALEQYDQLEKQQEDLKRQTAEASARIRALKAEWMEFDQLEKEVRQEITTQQQSRTVAAGKIEKSLVERYDSLLKEGDTTPVSPITDGICGNCFLKLTPQTMTHARRGAVTECDHCRHLVYLEDL